MFTGAANNPPDGAPGVVVPDPGALVVAGFAPNPPNPDGVVPNALETGVVVPDAGALVAVAVGFGARENPEKPEDGAAGVGAAPKPDVVVGAPNPVVGALAAGAAPNPVVEALAGAAPKLNPPPPAAPKSGAGGLLWGVVEPAAGALPNEKDGAARGSARSNPMVRTAHEWTFLWGISAGLVWQGGRDSPVFAGGFVFPNEKAMLLGRGRGGGK